MQDSKQRVVQKDKRHAPYVVYALKKREEALILRFSAKQASKKKTPFTSLFFFVDYVDSIQVESAKKRSEDK